MRNTDQLAKLVGEHAETGETIVRSVVESTFAVIVSELQLGHSVTISDFGKFSMLVPATRTSIDPRSEEPVEIQPVPVVRFVASRQLKDAVDPGFGANMADG